MLTDLDLVLLRRAIEIAGEARAEGNHPFGALLANKEGEVLAEAGNSVISSKDLTAHAEIRLSSMVSKLFNPHELETCTIYCSTEPCPMCAGAIHWSGIGRVVFALSQERLYQVTSESLEDKPLRLSCREVFSRCGRQIEVEGPALEEDAEIVHHGFWI